MKKLKLIYNPYSGERIFGDYLDECIAVFQRNGFEVHVFRSSEKGDIAAHISQMDRNYYDTIVASGGDGTLNIVLNAMVKSEINANFGIIPSGTANDFATFMKIPKNFEEAAEIIHPKNLKEVDLGLINSKYFINVCSGGLLTSVSQSVDEEMKTRIGKIAYYAKGFEQLPNFVPIPLRITNSTDVFEGMFYVFLVLNSSGAGGFDKLVPSAEINDGQFDFVAFRACPIPALAVLFVKLLSHDYLNDPNVLYFRDKYTKVEIITEGFDEEYVENLAGLNATDVDGEVGPQMPIEIINLHERISIYSPKEMI